MTNPQTIERYFQNWAQYDRQTYNEMILKADAENLTKKYKDFGDVFKKNKRQAQQLEDFYKTIKNQYGTVTQDKERVKKEYQEFKQSIDSDIDEWLKKKMGVKSINDFKDLKRDADKLETYFWDFYESGDAQQLMLINDGKSESERIRNVLEWLNNRNDFTFGKSQKYKRMTADAVRNIF